MTGPRDDSPRHVLLVVTLVSFCCALLVTTTATLVQPRIDANLDARRAARIQAIVASVPELADMLAATGADTLDTELVDLASGCVVQPREGELDEWRSYVDDETRSLAIPAELDQAGLQRRPLRVPVHRLAQDGRLALLVIPVYGKGYQSTIFAFLGLGSDFTTVAALSIVEQAETPGLGARIADDLWQAGWVGKTVLDTDGLPTIRVVKSGASTPREVDGISGATRTSKAIESMLHYWLGAHGFGPYLERLRQENPC